MIMRQGQAREGKMDRLCTAVMGPEAWSIEDKEDVQLVPKLRCSKMGGGMEGRKRNSGNVYPPECLDSRGFVVSVRALHTS